MMSQSQMGQDDKAPLPTRHKTLAFYASGFVMMAGFVLVLASYCHSRDREDTAETIRHSPDHATIMQVAIALSDIFVDIVLLINLYQGGEEFRSLFYWFLGSQIASFVFNAVIMAYIFWEEAEQRVQFLLWHLQNAYAFNFILTLACMDMQIVRIIHSQVFGLSSTNARITANTRSRLTTASFASMLIENIPQLAMEIVIAKKTEVVNDVVILAITLSAFDILQSLMGLITWTIVSNRRGTMADDLAEVYWRNTFAEPLVPTEPGIHSWNAGHATTRMKKMTPNKMSYDSNLSKHML